MWLWIAKETLQKVERVSKKDYLKASGIKHKLKHECFCCEYDHTHNDGKCNRCENCPLKWPLGARTLIKCMDKEYQGDYKGLYATWIVETDYKKAALLAYKISKLPERK